MAAEKIRSITYEWVQELATAGGGGSGTYQREIVTKSGRSSSRTISHKVMVKLEASAKVTAANILVPSTPGLSVGGEVELKASV